VAGFFDTAPLQRVVHEEIPWPRLQDNIARGVVRGVAMCTTEVCTGTSIVFYQTRPGAEFLLGRDPNKEAREVAIGPEHALASAAIPFLFPAVQIDEVCYTDGGLRQNTPLNPALRLGADRVLVVSVTQRPSVATPLARLGCRQNPFPGALFLLGKTVKVFLTQSLDYELGRVEMYNHLIEEGTKAFGEGFTDELNTIMGATRNARYRPVCTCHLRPSENLDRLALETLQEAPDQLRLPGLPGRFVSTLMTSDALAESELLSFLLFTPSYINKLLDLGYEDARACRDRLLQLYE
jgi:NTE family protein